MENWKLRPVPSLRTWSAICCEYLAAPIEDWSAPSGQKSNKSDQIYQNRFVWFVQICKISRRRRLIMGGERHPFGQSQSPRGWLKRNGGRVLMQTCPHDFLLGDCGSSPQWGEKPPPTPFPSFARPLAFPIGAERCFPLTRLPVAFPVAFPKGEGLALSSKFFTLHSSLFT